MLLAFVIAATVGNAKAAMPAPAAAPVKITKPVPAAPLPAATAAAAAPVPPEPVAIPAKITPAQRALIRVQVLLDRAHFSPGVIDGRAGGNLTAAADAYAADNGMATGMNAEKLAEVLAAKDEVPVLMHHTITQPEAEGPYLDKIPSDFTEMAKLKSLAYTSPRQALAEAFHMDELLLSALNPGADFARAGTVIVVAAAGSSAKLDATVRRIEVDKSHNRVIAFDGAGKILADYPATVGSTERPAPDGVWAVRAVAAAPTYTYDPKRLTFGKPATKLTIAAGPNNPVGSTWIDLTKDTYGLHGTPDPRLVGKRASHGCVRLTNWDAKQLGASVVKGTEVKFIGVETRAKS